MRVIIFTVTNIIIINIVFFRGITMVPSLQFEISPDTLSGNF